ncbi:MAG TPA: hypothetical protein VIO94_04080 [Phenylobacterium sp.]
MLFSSLAAALVMAASVSMAAEPATESEPAAKPAAEAAATAKPTTLEGVTVKRTCRTVVTTGSRHGKRVCTEAGAPSAQPDASGSLGVINRSQQGNINTGARR